MVCTTQVYTYTAKKVALFALVSYAVHQLAYSKVHGVHCVAAADCADVFYKFHRFGRIQFRMEILQM